MTITEFCDYHRACDEGRGWAVANCQTMQEAWDTARHNHLFWIATRPGVASDADLRKFAVWSARQVQHLLTDQSSLNALDVAERHANGLATDAELEDARAAAWTATRDNASDAAYSATLNTARTAARSAAWNAALACPVGAARDAAWSAQDAWLRKNITPNFEL